MYIEMSSHEIDAEKSAPALLKSDNSDEYDSIPGFQAEKNQGYNLFGVFLLFLLVIGGASMPSFINMWGEVSTFTKNMWRTELNFLISLPFTLHIQMTEPESIDYGYIFKPKILLLLFLSGAFFTGGCSCFVASAWLTISSHTLILAGLAGVILILIKIIS